jgi:hypothetical protein
MGERDSIGFTGAGFVDDVLQSIMAGNLKIFSVTP